METLEKTCDATGIKGKALIVEDEHTLRLGLRLCLNSVGWNVTDFETPAEALGLDEFDFDLILLDLRLPELSGIQMAQQLRARGINTPIILCSAHIENEIIMEGVGIGIVDYLKKPLSPQDLRTTANLILAGEEQEEGLPQVLHYARSNQTSKALEVLQDLKVSNKGKKSIQVWEMLLQGEFEQLKEQLKCCEAGLQEVVTKPFIDEDYCQHG